MSFFEIIPSIIEITKSLTGEILLLVILFIFRSIGIDMYEKSLFIVHYIYLIINKLFFHKKIIFIYTDADDNKNSSQSLSKHLDSSLKDYNVNSIVFHNSEEILNWPLSSKLVESIIIILTDVAPLSSNRKKRVKIQEKLIHYVHDGGILILGHDVLYRRTKNDMLQKFCGVMLTNFFRSDNAEIQYIKNINIKNRISTNKKLLENLPDTLSLNDREYVTGKWSNSVEYIYTTHEEIPLVTRQEIGHGVVFWINSGDHTEDGPPPSLSSPSKDLIILLDNIIRYSKDNKVKGDSRHLKAP